MNTIRLKGICICASCISGGSYGILKTHWYVNVQKEKNVDKPIIDLGILEQEVDTDDGISDFLKTLLSQKDEKTSEIEEFSQKIIEKTKKLNTLNQEKQELNTTLLEASSARQTLKDEISDIITEYESLNSQTQNYQDGLKKSQQDKQDADYKLQQTNVQITNAEDEVLILRSEFEQQKESAQTSIKSSEEKLFSNKNLLQKNTTDLEATAQAITEKNKQIQQKIKTITDQDKKIQNSNSVVSTKSSKRANQLLIVQDQKIIIKALDDELAKIQQKTQNIQGFVVSHQSAKAHEQEARKKRLLVAETIKTVTSRIDYGLLVEQYRLHSYDEQRFQYQAYNLQNKIQTMRHELSQEIQQETALQERLVEHKATSDEAMREYEEITAEVDALRKEIRGIEKTQDELQEQNKKEKKERKQLIQKRNDLTATKTSLTKAIQNQEETIEQIKSVLLELKIQSSHNQEKINNLKKEKSNQTSDLQQKINDLATQTKNFQEHKEKIDINKQQINEKQIVFDQYKDNIQNIKTTLSKTESEITSENQSKAKIEDQKSISCNQLNDINQKIQQKNVKSTI